MCGMLSSRLYWDPAKDDMTRLTGHARARAIKQIQKELNQLDDAARAARLAQLPLVERLLIDGNFAHNFYSLLVRLRHNPRDTEALEILGKLGFDKKTLPELQAAIRRCDSGIYSDKEFLDALRYDKGLESQGVPFDVWSGVDNARLYDEFGRMFKPGASELMPRPPVKFSFDGYNGPKKVYIFEDEPDALWIPRQLNRRLFEGEGARHLRGRDAVIFGKSSGRDYLGRPVNNFYAKTNITPEGLQALEESVEVVRLPGAPPKHYSVVEIPREADPSRRILHQKYEYFDLDASEFTPVETAVPRARAPEGGPGEAASPTPAEFYSGG